VIQSVCKIRWQRSVEVAKREREREREKSAKLTVERDVDFRLVLRVVLVEAIQPIDGLLALLVADGSGPRLLGVGSPGSGCRCRGGDIAVEALATGAGVRRRRRRLRISQEGSRVTQ
jgi:hypothetical protein